MNLLNLSGLDSSAFDAQLMDESQAMMIKMDDPISNAVHYALSSGGKRIRPALCFAACHFAGGDVMQAMKPAILVEMIHTASLMIDDLPCMDNDSVRRGRPSTHVIYGEATTILSAFSLMLRVIQHFLTEDFDNSMRATILTACENIILGQHYDITFFNNRGSLNDVESSILRIHDLKTGALIDSAVTSGAIAGGASAEVLTAMKKYGHSIGRAFQIMDDICDTHVDEPSYVNEMGIEKSHNEVRSLVTSAISALHEIECNTDRKRPLIDIAVYVADLAGVKVNVAPTSADAADASDRFPQTVIDDSTSGT